MTPATSQALTSDSPALISILCPTRGRPANMVRMAESALQEAEHHTSVECLFYIDDDDSVSVEQAENLKETYFGTVDYVKGPRIQMSDMWNKLAREACGEILMLCGDDIVFRSSQWDVHIRGIMRSYPDRIVYVHGRDGVQDARLGTHGFIHRRWFDVIGYFTPPYFSCDYADAWVNDVADMIGRRHYTEAVFTEHMHPDFGKAERDQTHLERAQRGAEDNVAQLYVDKYPERVADAEKLRKFIKDFSAPTT